MTSPATPADLAELKRLAEAATPGQRLVLVPPDELAIATLEQYEGARLATDADRALASACDPGTVLALIAELEQLRAGAPKWVARADAQFTAAFDALGPPKDGMKALLPSEDKAIRVALESAQQELGALRVVADSLRNLQCELKGAQLMIFEADTPEKRSKVFGVVGAVVAWIMAAERELRPSPPEAVKP